MKPKGKKPRGAAGSLTLDLPRAAHFEPLHLPDTKAAIEEVVLRAALSSSDGLLSRLYGLRGCPIRNPEDHFDFTLPVQPSGEHFLDLSEFVYPTRVGDPYSRADGWYVVGDMAEAVWDAINAKDAKYGRNRHAVVHLLLYTTHRAFQFGREVLDLVSFWSRTRSTEFRSIAWFNAYTPDAGEVIEVVPRSDLDLSNFDEDATRKTTVLLSDPAKFRFEKDGRVVVPLSGPPHRPQGRVMVKYGPLRSADLKPK